jgi:catechol 2,3-dioxygenase-like lactoylglutathione lyase family enzyme
MLSDHEAIAIVAVRNLKTAAEFYEGKLGLKEASRQGEHLIGYHCGNSVLNVYRSDFAGTNQANAVTWSVGDDLEAVVQALKAKGVFFEHYDLPGTKLEGDLHIGNGMKAAWFKDPDGNILNIVGR